MIYDMRKASTKRREETKRLFVEFYKVNTEQELAVGIKKRMSNLLKKSGFQMSKDLDEFRLFLAINAVGMRLVGMIDFYNVDEISFTRAGKFFIKDYEIPNVDIIGGEMIEGAKIKSLVDATRVWKWMFDLAYCMPDLHLFKAMSLSVKDGMVHAKFVGYPPEGTYPDWE